jgi:predicted site-specific integrase-resolvase
MPRLVTSNNRPPPDRRLTIRELATVLGVSPRTIQGWRRHGRSPIGLAKVGGKITASEKEALALLETQRSVSTA